MTEAPHGYCAVCFALGKPGVPAIKWEGVPICQAHHDETMRKVRADHAARQKPRTVAWPPTREEVIEHAALAGGGSLSSLAELHRPAGATVH